MKSRLGRRLILVLDQGGRAFPADFNAAEKIGFRPRHFEKPRRFEFQTFGTEDFRVPGKNITARAALVRRRSDFFKLGARFSLGDKSWRYMVAPAADFDDQIVGERVNDRNADAVQAARRVTYALPSNFPPE